MQDLGDVVREYAAKQGYSMVLEASSGALIYIDKSNDVTDEIVRIYNSSPRREHSGKRGEDKD